MQSAKCVVLNVPVIVSTVVMKVFAKFHQKRFYLLLFLSAGLS